MASLCLVILYVGTAFALFESSLSDRALASSKVCFGKKVNRVVRADDATVRVAFRDVVWVSGRGTKVIGKPYSRICAGPGPQTIRAGKGRSLTDSGSGDDRIILHPSSNRSKARAGVGDDFVRGSNGHDIIHAGPAVPNGDTDRIFGRGGNDRIIDFGGLGNEIFGQNGSDRIHSLGRAISTVHGGNGTDFLHSNGGGSKDSRIERLFGERGNDRLRADRPGGSGGAFLDPGPGDDWIWGTDRADTIVFSSGLKKIEAGGGDDLIVTAGRGGERVVGGSGSDTISYATHTPPGYRRTTGVFVDLAEGYSIGSNRFEIGDFENVIGSSFDDQIIGAPGVENEIWGALGNDTLTGNPGDRDFADGGIGQNRCFDFADEVDCNKASPGDFGSSKSVVEIDESGVLALIGSSLDDEIAIAFDPTLGRFSVSADPSPETDGLCRPPEVPDGPVLCPVSKWNLNGMLVYGAGGDDGIRIADSVPAALTTTINGGSGRNVLKGGRSKDYIASDAGTSAGTVIDGRGGSDLLYLRDDVSVLGGGGADVLHAVDPCVGGTISGGDGKDNLVFAAAGRGVHANLGRGTAVWAAGGCPSGGVGLKHDIEELEGSKYDDVLVLGPRFKAQDGPGGLLGRGGIDVLNSRNGRRDTVTVGSGGRRNTVKADPFDRVHWDWGLARG